jgi:hypothetical protein
MQTSRPCRGANRRLTWGFVGPVGLEPTTRGFKSWTTDLGRVACTLAPLTYCLSMLAILASYDSPSLTEPLTDWTGA